MDVTQLTMGVSGETRGLLSRYPEFGQGNLLRTILT